MIVQKSHLSFLVIAFHIPNQALFHILGKYIDFVRVGAKADFSANIKNAVNMPQILGIFNTGLVVKNYAIAKTQKRIRKFSQEKARQVWLPVFCTVA